jgi:phosphoribosylanthranilate isomerase
MPLKTLVKVGSITNLSDARYCSGMEVDFLGFRVNPLDPDYISPKLFQEIRGWIPGPKIVAELNGLSTPDLAQIMQDYAPDFFEMDLDQFQNLNSTPPIPIFLNVSKHKLSNFKTGEQVSFAIIEESMIEAVPSAEKMSLMVTATSQQAVQRLLNNPLVQGFALTGSKELRPGFKDYDQLADILESLEQ